MKRTVLITLALILLLSFTSCGNSDSDDPNVGTWSAVSATMLGIEMEVSELFEGGVSLELKANGKFSMDVDGEKGNGKWSLDGEVLKLTSDVDISGTIKNGVLTLTNLLDMGVDISFVKDGAEPPPSGASAGEAGYYVLHSGTEDGITVTADELGVEWYIVLKENGDAEIMLDRLATGTWKSGKITCTSDGTTEKLNYAIDGDELTLDIEGLVLRFVRSNDAPPASKPASSGSSSAPEKDLPEYLQWWDGNWYGYWEISGTTDAYDELDDGRWDCFAVVDMDEAGAGTLTLWDEYETVATAEIQASEMGGSGSMGAAMSEGGSFMDSALSHADWIIDPSLYGYDDYMVIDGYYEDPLYPDEGFYYYCYLRPWGLLWDDISADERPPHYSDWYLDVYTSDMSEVQGETDSVSGSPDYPEENPGEYVWSDELFISWPVESFYLNDWGLVDIVSSDESVKLTVFPYSNLDSYIQAMNLYSQYESYSGYTIEFLEIAGYEAVKITYDGYDTYTTSVYLNFNNEGQDGTRYYGVMVDCVSKVDMASTWTQDILDVLETIIVTTGNPN